MCALAVACIRSAIDARNGVGVSDHGINIDKC